MSWIIDNIALISLILSIINIGITLYNWYYRRPRLEFYDDGQMHYFRPTNREELCYKNSKCIVFYNIKIANLSDMPCTISRFSLECNGYAETYYRSNTQVLHKYVIYKNPSNLQYAYINGDRVIKMPCTIPPLGYAEGILVFPYAPMYKEDEITATVTAYTARKPFYTSGLIRNVEKISPDHF